MWCELLVRSAPRPLAARLFFWVGIHLLLGVNARAQFVAFYDYSPGAWTASGAVGYGPSGSGPLLNIANGLPTGVTVAVTNAGVVTSGVQGGPDYGTPASVVFDGFVDFGGNTSPGLELSSGAVLAYNFSGLDPAASYNLQGTAIRGEAAYTDRWSQFEIVGAAAFSSAHSPGALTAAQVPGLAATQVAINTGDNTAGVLAWWENIRPGPGGAFSVVCRQYIGAVPGGSSGGSKGYGLTGFRLEQAPVYGGRSYLPARRTNGAPATINGVKTVFLILMENHDWNTLLGSPNCPYLNTVLLPQASSCSRYYSPRDLHPSEPNYLWLVAGTNFGLRNDNPPSANHQSSTNTLFHLLDSAGLSWRTYQEDITGTTIPDVNNGHYAVRHNPFVFFDEVLTNLDYCTNHVRPFTELAGDLANQTVARFNFLTPNLTNDMHDPSPGSPSTRIQGDAWLARTLPTILTSPAYTNGGALFITFDEGGAASDGPIGMILLSPRAKGGGSTSSRLYDHSSMLRTVQDILGVRPYLGAAAYANSLSDLFLTIHLTLVQTNADSLSLTYTNVIRGKTNVLQATPDLAVDSWSNLQTNVATDTSMTISDRPPADTLRRFYRLLELP
jgi:phosphatidylinositol-3-phosphatase